MSITKKFTQYDDNEYKQPTRLVYQINTKAKSTKVNVTLYQRAPQIYLWASSAHQASTKATEARSDKQSCRARPPADAFSRQENLVVIVPRVYSADMGQESWLLGGKLCTAWSQLSLGKP